MNRDNLRQKYSELVALTQLYLMQEYPLDKRIPAEPASFEYFKQYAIKQKQSKQSTPIVTQTPKVAQSPNVAQTPNVVRNSNVARNSDFERPSPAQSRAPTEIPASPPTLPTPPKTTSSNPTPTPPPEKKPEKSAETPTPLPPPSPPPSLSTSPIPPTPQPIKTPEKTEKKGPHNSFELQPLEAPASSDFTDIRGLIAPSISVIDAIPNDSIAKQLLSGWKQQPQAQAVMVLSFNENEKQKIFLTNLTKAIQLCLAPAQMIPADKIEKDKDWEKQLQSPDLRLILASDYGIYALPELMKHYKEDSKNAKRFLGKIPLLLLPDLSVYLKEPSLKPSLWRALCEILSPK